MFSFNYWQRLQKRETNEKLKYSFNRTMFNSVMLL